MGETNINIVLMAISRINNPRTNRMRSTRRRTPDIGHVLGGSVSMELFNQRTHLEAEVAEVKALDKLTNIMYNYELSRACKMPSRLFCFVF